MSWGYHSIIDDDEIESKANLVTPSFFMEENLCQKIFPKENLKDNNSRKSQHLSTKYFPSKGNYEDANLTLLKQSLPIEISNNNNNNANNNTNISSNNYSSNNKQLGQSQDTLVTDRKQNLTFQNLQIENKRKKYHSHHSFKEQLSKSFQSNYVVSISRKDTQNEIQDISTIMNSPNKSQEKIQFHSESSLVDQNSVLQFKDYSHLQREVKNSIQQLQDTRVMDNCRQYLEKQIQKRQQSIEDRSASLDRFPSRKRVELQRQLDQIKLEEEKKLLHSYLKEQCDIPKRILSPKKVNQDQKNEKQEYLTPENEANSKKIEPKCRLFDIFLIEQIEQDTSSSSPSKPQQQFSITTFEKKILRIFPLKKVGRKSVVEKMREKEKEERQNYLLHKQQLSKIKEEKEIANAREDLVNFLAGKIRRNEEQQYERLLPPQQENKITLKELGIKQLRSGLYQGSCHSDDEGENEINYYSKREHKKLSQSTLSSRRCHSQEEIQEKDNVKFSSTDEINSQNENQLAFLPQGKVLKSFYHMTEYKTEQQIATEQKEQIIQLKKRFKELELTDKQKYLCSKLEQDDHIEIQYILNIHPSLLSMKFKNGDSLLHVACRKSSQKIVKLILQLGGGNCNSLNQNLKTPIEICRMTGKEKLANYLEHYKEVQKLKERQYTLHFSRKRSQEIDKNPQSEDKLQDVQFNYQLSAPTKLMESSASNN